MNMLRKPQINNFVVSVAAEDGLGKWECVPAFLDGQDCAKARFC